MLVNIVEGRSEERSIFAERPKLASQMTIRIIIVAGNGEMQFRRGRLWQGTFNRKDKSS